MLKLLSFLNKLTIQKKLGLLFLLSILIINQYVWIWLFDNDGYLKELNKIRILIINSLLFIIGISLFFLEFELKKIAKQVLYIVYLILFIELASFFTIKVLLNSNNDIDYFLSDNT